jgi:hypothetical protein
LVAETIAIEHLRQNHTHANPKEALAHVQRALKVAAQMWHVTTHHVGTFLNRMLAKSLAIRVRVLLETVLHAQAVTLRRAARVALLKASL